VQCGISPSILNLSGGNPAAATLTLTILPPSGNTTVTLVHQEPINSPPSLSGWKVLSAVACLVCSALLALSRWPRRYSVAFGLASACTFAFLIGCGAGGGAGGGGGGGGGRAPTSLTLSTPSSKEPFQSAAAFTVAVKSTMPATGYVTILDSGVQFEIASVVNGTATAPLGGMYPGTHVITAQYSGDTNNLPSQTNGFINQVITGTTQVYVQGATSTLSRTTQLNVTIQ
jgi:Big-like domain-containing protein